MDEQRDPFDLSRAKAGEFAYDERGRPLRLHAHLPHLQPSHRLVFFTRTGRRIRRCENGHRRETGHGIFDLYMKSNRLTQWEQVLK